MIFEVPDYFKIDFWGPIQCIMRSLAEDQSIGLALSARVLSNSKILTGSLRNLRWVPFI